MPRQTRKIEHLNFDIAENPELLNKLNSVAPYEYITVHALAQRIMLQQLDKLIAEYGITVVQNQPAGTG